ncbi:hypothetical protein GobsT_12520 [Gemmata obscuriglobus]|uniref:Uncharacterized protein n=1 Tax=Gemmata obscuriglobus TaxID=114 RepID=A0A2Z3HEV3_9BACT|nr:hypothetical protein [Gemmata obscuriglobus]AWM40284.1 hypothetical protein C1280_26955 [Gemmata obscuriglobus]QEG26512.1 hypothetical protein GobsT_12520 [Gemmata obscuriglobus]VTS01824.1 unnamed protein product [Gemmata obscuriglobus UQM 2246]
MQAKFKTRDGVEKTVVHGDPLFCTLDNCRVRFVRMVDSTSVEVMDANTGRLLPDYRHPVQLFAY